jgi:hypothetical protein
MARLDNGSYPAGALFVGLTTLQGYFYINLGPTLSTLFRRNEAENASFRFISKTQRSNRSFGGGLQLCLNPEAPLFPKAFGV